MRWNSPSFNSAPASSSPMGISRGRLVEGMLAIAEGGPYLPLDPFTSLVEYWSSVSQISSTNLSLFPPAPGGGWTGAKRARERERERERGRERERKREIASVIDDDDIGSGRLDHCLRVPNRPTLHI